MVFDFVDSGTEDEVTLKRNVEAFRELTLRPRALVDVSRRDLSTTVLGQKIALPVILGPTGLQGLLHPQGELAAARAAGSAGTIYVLSNGPSHAMEDVAAVASGPLWFQLYIKGERDAGEQILARAAAAGFSALCLTVDCAVVGTREKNRRNGLSLPFRPTIRTAIHVCRRPWWLRTAYHTLYRHTGNFPRNAAHSGTLATMASWAEPSRRAAATWDDLRWLRRAWSEGLVVKGILTAEDARRAADAGADAIVVSNHGGRQLDGSPATIEALPEIVDAVGDRIEVLIDGGIRRGTDVVKAIALGARACLIARPYVLALALGPSGPGRILEILRHEIDTTLALVGVRSVCELDRSSVAFAPAHSADPAPAQT